MRIRDWSSDVCSSDLESAMMSARAKGVFNPELLRGRGAWIDEGRTILHFGNGLIIDGEETPLTDYSGRYIYERAEALPMPELERPLSDEEASRTEERRVGKECVSTSRYRWVQYH